MSPIFMTAEMLDIPGGGARDADDRDGKADMAERGPELPACACSRGARTVSESGACRKRARHKTSQTEATRTHAPSASASAGFATAPAQHAATLTTARDAAAIAERRAASADRRASRRGRCRTEPRAGAERKSNHRRIEKRPANRNFVARHGLKRHRVERADQHDAAAHRQQQVVEDKAAFAREEREGAAGRKRAGPPCEERKPARGESR